MNAEAMNYVPRLKVGNITAKFVLHRLAGHADENFSCAPEVGLLAAELEVSGRTIQRAMKLLRGLGYVPDAEQFHEDGAQSSNRYVLHGPWDDFGGTGRPFPTLSATAAGGAL